MPRRNTTHPVNDNAPGAGSSRPAQSMDAPNSKPVKGTCPICAAPRNETYKPFCSKRCADVDLNRWLSGSYAIPVIEEDGGRSSGDDTQ